MEGNTGSKRTFTKALSSFSMREHQFSGKELTCNAIIDPFMQFWLIVGSEKSLSASEYSRISSLVLINSVWSALFDCISSMNLAALSIWNISSLNINTNVELSVCSAFLLLLPMVKGTTLLSKDNWTLSKTSWLSCQLRKSWTL